MPDPYLEGPASPYAGFWNRVGAGLIDGVVIMTVLYLVGMVVIPSESWMQSALFEQVEQGVYHLAPLGYVVVGLSILLYKAVMESSHEGATIGKRVVKLEVTGANGVPLGFGRATLRSAPVWAPWVIAVPQVQWLVAILSLGCCVAVLKSDRKQGWHDRLVGALVVHRGTRFKPADAS
jgi:uncharacterized RDD family membrane protein YckC